MENAVEKGAKPTQRDYTLGFTMGVVEQFEKAK